MRRYLVTCDIHRSHRQYPRVAQQIRAMGNVYEHPHDGVWVVETAFSAADLRAALLPLVNFSDRLFVCEAGNDMAGFNAPMRRAEFNVVPFESRKRSALLDSVLAKGPRQSRMLRAATGGNWR